MFRRFLASLTLVVVLLSIGMMAVPAKPASAAPSAPQAVIGYLLRLYTLTCSQTEDSGNDEAYITVNGTKVWGATSVNEPNSYGVNRNVFFGNSAGGTALVRLYDEDGPFDDDDLLGSVGVTAAQAGTGPRFMFFTGDGASYALTYEVVAVSV